MTCLAHDLRLSFMSDRQKNAPWGVLGGGSGATGSLTIRRQGDNRFRDFVEDSGKVSPSKFSNVPIQDGDQVRLRTPGGGGYGDPSQRPKSAVADDIAEGWVSEKGAGAYRT